MLKYGYFSISAITNNWSLFVVLSIGNTTTASSDQSVKAAETEETWFMRFIYSLNPWWNLEETECHQQNMSGAFML